MTSHPILFKAEMVRAILEGRKTQTRRILKPQPFSDTVLTEMCKTDPVKGWQIPGHSGIWWDDDATSQRWKCPYGVPGDELWAKETFQLWDHSFESVEVVYAAARSGLAGKVVTFKEGTKPAPDWIHRKRIDGKKVWKPSIFMPRWASRITLEVVSVRVERMREMSNEDAQAEGIEVSLDEHSVNLFADLWDSINRKTHPWASNPLVWRIEFRRIK